MWRSTTNKLSLVLFVAVLYYYGVHRNMKMDHGWDGVSESVGLCLDVWVGVSYYFYSVSVFLLHPKAPKNLEQPILQLPSSFPRRINGKLATTLYHLANKLYPFGEAMHNQYMVSV